MKTNARILVATDLGDAGDQAIETAVAWSRHFQGAMTVVHVAPHAQGHDQARARLAERIAALTAEADIDLRVTHGAPADQILALADEVSADLIVLGGREAGGMRWIFGSVADRVLTRARIPVLVARPAGNASPHILAATDFSEPSLPAVAAAHEVSRRFSAPVTIVHVIESDDHHSGISALTRQEGADPEVISAARARLREICNQSPETDTSRVVVGDAARNILQLAERLPASLVVVASNGRRGLARFVVGSVAARLVRDASCSVLVVRLR